jgi:hypothetical protein
MPDWHDPTTQAYLMGSLAIALEWRSYYVEKASEFRRWSALGAVLWSLQYLLLHAWTAGITMAVTALRTLSSRNFTDPNVNHGLAGGFVLLFAGLTYLSWQGPVSILPGFAVINTTVALFYLGNRSMRIALLASSLVWLLNDFYWKAWPALIAEIVAIGINLRTIYRLFAR